MATKVDNNQIKKGPLQGQTIPSFRHVGINHHLAQYNVGHSGVSELGGFVDYLVLRSLIMILYRVFRLEDLIKLAIPKDVVRGRQYTTQ